MRTLILLATLAISVSAAAAQKVLFKDEIDGLVRSLRASAPASGAYGDGSVLQTAQVLTAMGYCHRFYAVTDGPVVRNALNFLAKHRGADRLYHETEGDDAVLTTRWVLDAMAVLGPREFQQDLLDGRRALRGLGDSGTPPFAQLLDDLRQQVKDPAKLADAMQHAGTESATRAAHGLIVDAAGKPDHAASVAALLRLVACQVVARGPATAAPAHPASPVATWTDAQQRGVDYLLTNQKAGVFQVPTPKGPIADVGFTALCLAAVQTKPKARRTAAETAAIDAGLTWLASQQREDGTFSTENDNYIACTAIMALTAADDPQWKPVIAKAQRLVLALQNAEGRGYARSDRDYGSIGYGGDERGDLSNLQFAVDALRKSGVEPGQTDAFEKALVFLQRCQNLKATNDLEVDSRNDETGEWRKMVSGDDGGSVYYPGNSPMGYVDLPDGKSMPRSYGSMTYALLKAYTMCGLPADDPRIVAAVRWLQSNWTITENPGADASLPEKTRHQGLFYYYMVMAQALHAAKIDALDVKAADGATRKVDWRAELRAQLATLQGKDGSWVNAKNGRWWEMLPMTCTCYALLALDLCQ